MPYEIQQDEAQSDSSDLNKKFGPQDEDQISIKEQKDLSDLQYI